MEETTKKKRKRGRPRKPETEKLVTITFKVSPEVYKKIRALGSKSAWIFRDFWDDYFTTHDNEKQG